MSPDLKSAIDELQERLTRLERAPQKPRGHTNQIGAARYLGRSEEWLRMQHARGGGPKRSRNGRFYIYSYADLDAFAEQDTA